MRVLKIMLEGDTTSFRYPHFVQGLQPSFDMPPPATIYGHICSALGELVSPQGIAFTYHFTFAGKVQDVEHVHLLSPSSGKLPGTQLPKAMEGNINPFKREMLFRPRLTLYLNRPEWLPSFRSPRYTVVLGRSQDLCTYTQVEEVELEQTTDVYFEHTLLPYDMAVNMQAGVVALLPRWLNPEQGRTPTFERYLLLHQRVYAQAKPQRSQAMLYFGEQDATPVWCDPTAPVIQGARRGLIFHRFVEER